MLALILPAPLPAGRYVDSAQRTLHRMELTWKHMYTSAIKPLVDKVLGKDDGHT
jgi:hypothetical protein